jgi:hypothetical protein
VFCATSLATITILMAVSFLLFFIFAFAPALGLAPQTTIPLFVLALVFFLPLVI